MSIADSIPRKLTFRLDLDPAETVRATRAARKTRRWAWLSWAIYPVILLTCVLYLATGTPLWELWRYAAVMAGLAALSLLASFTQRRALRRAYQNTPSLRVPQVYTFSDAGLSIANGMATTSLGWDAFVRAMETREFFLLFYNDRSAYYLPKRVIRGPAAEAELRALLDAHLGVRSKQGK